MIRTGERPPERGTMTHRCHLLAKVATVSMRSTWNSGLTIRGHPSGVIYPRSSIWGYPFGVIIHSSSSGAKAELA